MDGCVSRTHQFIPPTEILQEPVLMRRCIARFYEGPIVYHELQVCCGQAFTFKECTCGFLQANRNQ